LEKELCNANTLVDANGVYTPAPGPTCAQDGACVGFDADWNTGQCITHRTKLTEEDADNFLTTLASIENYGERWRCKAQRVNHIPGTVLGFMLLVQFFMFCVAICKKPAGKWRSVMIFWAYTTFIFTWFLIYHMNNNTTQQFVQNVICTDPKTLSGAVYLRNAQMVAGKTCYSYDMGLFPDEPADGVYNWEVPAKWNTNAAALGQHVPRDPLAHQFQVGVVACHFGEAFSIVIQLAFLWFCLDDGEGGAFDNHEYGGGNAQGLVTRQPSKV
jgi:hypothetical protein